MEKEKEKKPFKGWNHFHDEKAPKDCLDLFILISQFMGQFYNQ